MTRVDSNTSTQTVYGTGDDIGTQENIQKTSQGVGSDKGGIESELKSGLGTKGGVALQLDPPPEDINSQSYSDSAQALGSFDITDALIALAKASNKDKESDNDSAITKINTSFNKSMDAVGQEKKAAWDNFWNTEISAGMDMVGQGITAGTAASTMASSETSEARLMAQSARGQAIGGITGDSGKLVGGIFGLKAGQEQANADSDKAQAQKESSYGETDRSHAQYADQMLSMVVQVLQQKAQAEHDAKVQQANYS